MNKSLSGTKRMVEEPIAYEKAVKHEVVSKTKTLSGLISEFQEEVQKAYGINHNFTYQIDRLIGCESMGDKCSGEVDEEIPSLLIQLEDLINSLGILNVRNNTQYYRLNQFIGG